MPACCNPAVAAKPWPPGAAADEAWQEDKSFRSEWRSIKPMKWLAALYAYMAQSGDLDCLEGNGSYSLKSTL